MGKYRKFLMAMFAAFAMVTALAACRKDAEETAVKKEYKAFTYLAAEADERMVTGLSGDRLYYVKHVSGGYELYASDMDTGQAQKLYGEADQDAPFHVVMLAAASNNQAALLKYKDVQADGDVSGRTYSVMVFKPDGAVRAEYDVTASLAGEKRPKAMLTDISGNVYFVLGNKATSAYNGNNASILAFDAAGKLAHTFTPEENDALENSLDGLFSDGEGHVYCACSSVGASGDRLLQVMELSASEKSLREVCQLTAGRAADTLFAGGRGHILFSEGDVLYQLDIKSGEKTEILRWMNVNINYGDVQDIALRENGDIGVYRSYVEADANAVTGGSWKLEATLVRENKALQSEMGGDSLAGLGSQGQENLFGGSLAAAGQEKGQTVLVYATMHLDDQMRSCIVEYNSGHPECRIEVREYGGEGKEAGMLRLNTDILAGHVPDILDLDNIDVGPYIAKGILTDLYPFMDADAEMGRDEFVPGILKQYEEDGKLYGVMAGYRLETLMGKESVLGTPAGWTIERMQEALAEVPEDGCFVNNLAPMGLLRILMAKGMGEYLDWERGTCSFDSREFISVLRLANSMGGKAMDGDMEENLSSGRISVNRIYVDGISDYISSMEMFHGERVSCVGFPSAQGGSALVYPFRPFGISGQNGHGEMAWDFVRTLLGEDFQTKEVRFNLPIRLSVLQKKLAQEAEMAAQKERPIAQEDLDAIYQMLNVSNGKITFDQNVWNIISEEAEFYFNGQKSAEDVAKTIQNRAGVYVSENY